MRKTHNNVSIQIFDDLDNYIDGNWIRKIASCVLAELNEISGVVSIVIISDEVMAELNLQHRGLEEPTDVLSFSYKHNGTYYGSDIRKKNFTSDLDFILPPEVDSGFGEVVISYPQAKRQANKAGHTIDKELVVLVAHGILHLLGYDHETEDELQTMKAMEARALNAIVSSGML